MNSTTRIAPGGKHRRFIRRAPSDPGLAALAMDLHLLSRGSVRKISAHGPVLAARPARRRPSSSTFTSVLGTPDRQLVGALSGCWAISLAAFWWWWFAPAHRTSVAGLTATCAVLAYITCYPAFFVVAANRLSRVSRSLGVPDLRVAFVVTKAPSEPWDVARSTLCAMREQDFPVPYDVWLCDEAPAAEVLGWCAEHCVAVAARQSAEDYHRVTWPRRTRCKEGNLAYFYDHWGYRDYDVVAQLDCDHRPSPTYLTEMVRPFADPAVGYVAAPSVCDANAANSWAARGRLYREAVFQGAFQLGHNDGGAPVCIGSHYAVRTAALRDIGGIGPELAEDFSTSFLLNSAGWHGAFAIDAEAHGDGPNTFAAMLVQEFQWSRSLTAIFLRLIPGNIGHLPWPLRIRFLYPLIYYPLLVLSTLGGLLLAVLAAVTGRPWIDVNYFVFLAHWWSIWGWLLLLTLFLRRRGLLRPRKAPVVSWEIWLYALARWPYIALGICSALAQTLRPRPVTFRVTPKGPGGLEPLPVRLMLPYLLISTGSSAAALHAEASNNAVGYAFLCVAAGLMYSIVGIAVPYLHASEAATPCKLPTRVSLLRTSLGPLVIGCISLLTAGLALVRYPAYAFHVLRI